MNRWAGKPAYRIQTRGAQSFNRAPHWPFPLRRGYLTVSLAFIPRARWGVQ